MPKIFISYRRNDSRKDAGRIYDRLVEAFGKSNIFKDVDNIPFGRDFREVLSEAVNQCDVMLVVIGQHWINIEDELGNRRLDNPVDFVRIEVQIGVQRGDARCFIIPVLVDGAAMPNANQLPSELRELAFKNAVTVRDDPDFHNDVGRLIKQLKQDNSNSKPTLPMWPRFVRLTRSPAAIVALILIIALVLFLLSRVIQNAATLPTPTMSALLSSDTPQATKAISVVTISPSLEVIAHLTNTLIPTVGLTSTEVLSKTPTSILTNTTTSTASFTAKPSATLTPTPMPVPTDTAVPYILHNADWKPVEKDFNGVTMVEVPAGCFNMGSENGDNDEKPVTRICFNHPFWIDKTEVTNAQFTAFESKISNPSHWTDANRPRETITWFEAGDFCELRGGRLPTEAEWEYAARGPDNFIYPWGNDFNGSNVIYNDTSNSQTAPVGSKLSGASWVGALDMSGNVWEWVSTLYNSYPYPIADSTILDSWIASSNTTNPRVLHGGSWRDNTPYNLRTSYRAKGYPTNSDINDGFRCARSS